MSKIGEAKKKILHFYCEARAATDKRPEAPQSQSVSPRAKDRAYPRRVDGHRFDPIPLQREPCKQNLQVSSYCT